jgi:hypothetical protein
MEAKMTTAHDTGIVPKIGGNYLGVPIFAIGIAVALLPQLIYQTYEAADGMPMRCHATANAEIAVGAAIFIFGAMYFFAKSAKLRLAASVMALIAAALALLFPTALTGLCGDAHMPCHTLTLPLLIVCASFIALFSLIGAALSVRTLLRPNGESR